MRLAMCGCAPRRIDIAAASRAALRGDVAEIRSRVGSIAASARLDLEMARQAAARMMLVRAVR